MRDFSGDAGVSFVQNRCSRINALEVGSLGRLWKEQVSCPGVGQAQFKTFWGPTNIFLRQLATL